MSKSVKMRFLLCLIFSYAIFSCAGQQTVDKKAADYEKAPKEVVVTAPTSVSSKIDEAKAIAIIITKSEKVYLQLGDSTRKYDIFKVLNKNKKLNLHEADIDQLMQLDSIGIPFAKLKTMLGKHIPAQKEQLLGIPCSANTNELTDWLKACVEVEGLDRLEKSILFIKGDGNHRYQSFKHVKDAFKQNHIFRFRIVTTP